MLTPAWALSLSLFFNRSPFGNLKPLNVSILMRFSKREREKVSRIIRACGMLGGGGNSKGPGSCFVSQCLARKRNAGASCRKVLKE